MGHLDYTLHNQASSLMRRFHTAAAINTGMMAAAFRIAGISPIANELDAASRMHEQGANPYDKPAFGLTSTMIGDRQVAVREEIVQSKPFCNLLRFRRDTDRNDPKVLLVAPLSGHYATLLRGTVQELLPHHDVHITDWANARDVSMKAGRFGLDEYVGYVQDFLRTMGPNTHVIAICQPTVPTLAAASLMAARKDPGRPASLTLVAGPINTAAAPTEVTKLADTKPLSWFKNNVISTVPHGNAGVGRHVYPGFIQLTAFMAMNPERHARSARDMYNHLRRGDGQSAEKIEKFYKEYLAVLDLTEEFYLETVDRVFQRRLLANGQFTVADQLVNPAAITDIPLFTVEGGRDDISAPGQTSDAHRLCSGLNPALKHHFLCPEAGHYGTFEGRHFREQILPRIAFHIRADSVDKGLKYDEIPANTRLIPPNLWQPATPAVNPFSVAPKRDITL